RRKQTVSVGPLHAAADRVLAIESGQFALGQRESACFTRPHVASPVLVGRATRKRPCEGRAWNVARSRRRHGAGLQPQTTSATRCAQWIGLLGVPRRLLEFAWIIAC